MNKVGGEVGLVRAFLNHLRHVCSSRTRGSGAVRKLDSNLHVANLVQLRTVLLNHLHVGLEPWSGRKPYSHSNCDHSGGGTGRNAGLCTMFLANMHESADSESVDGWRILA